MPLREGLTMARFKPGDRVYHRHRDQHGTYESRTTDLTAYLVTFDGNPEPERVSAHLIERSETKPASGTN